MYNVATIKRILIIAVLAVPSIVLNSCQSDKSKNTDNSTEAQSMIVAAQRLYDNQLYDSAISVIDSIYKRYPQDIEALRQAINIKVQAQEKSILAQLEAADSIIATNGQIVTNIARKFKTVDSSDMVESYRVIKSISTTPLINRTAIEPRIDSNGNMYIISLLHGHSVHHDQLSVHSTNGKSASTTKILYDNSRNYRFSDNGTTNEMVTFNSKQCTDFCQFITDNIGAKLTVSFIGQSSYKIDLSETMQQAIADTYKYSVAIKAGLNAEQQKLLLNKKLEIAKRQIEQIKL